MRTVHVAPVADPADQVVAALATVERVVAGPALQGVVPVPAQQQVVAARAHEAVVVRAAVEILVKEFPLQGGEGGPGGLAREQDHAREIRRAAGLGAAQRQQVGGQLVVEGHQGGRLQADVAERGPRGRHPDPARGQADQVGLGGAVAIGVVVEEIAAAAHAADHIGGVDGEIAAGVAIDGLGGVAQERAGCFVEGPAIGGAVGIAGDGHGAREVIGVRRDQQRHRRTGVEAPVGEARADMQAGVETDLDEIGAAGVGVAVGLPGGAARGQGKVDLRGRMGLARGGEALSRHRRIGATGVGVVVVGQVDPAADMHAGVLDLDRGQMRQEGRILIDGGQCHALILCGLPVLPVLETVPARAGRRQGGWVKCG